MKKLILAVVTMLASASIQASPQASFSIGITTQHETFVTGSEIRITVAATNISNDEIQLAKDNAKGDRAEFTYDIEVFDSSGKAVPPNRSYRILKGKDVPDETKLSAENRQPNRILVELPNSSQQYLPLKPGEKITDTCLVSRLFDLTKPGKYTIQAKRFDPISSNEVYSNSITITVMAV